MTARDTGKTYTPEQGESLCRGLADYVNNAIGATPRLTLPSVQQFHGEVSVMLYRRAAQSTSTGADEKGA